MARLARIVAPNIPHFITQRGNRGQDVFFQEGDALAYIGFLGEQCKRFGVEVWAYCLMPNRAHLLAVPQTEDSLGRAFGEAHRRYTNMVNARMGWSGHLWQSRFSSFPLDEPFILPAAHFIEMSPVMAGFCKEPEAFRWSSAKAHIKGQDDALCAVAPLRKRGHNRFMVSPADRDIAAHIGTGRPLGNRIFIERLEKETGRALKKKKPGRKRKTLVLA